MPTFEEAKAWYDERDLVHGFDHVVRVLRMAENLGRELGADLEILRAAALLHDAAGAHPVEGDEREVHEQGSAVFARRILEQEGWEGSRIEAVVHCIHAHRYRGEEEPRTLEARILFDSDKLDVNGAFGVARTIGYAVQAGLPIFEEPSRRFLERGELEPGELHSAYHEYLFKLRHVKARFYTEPARRLGEHRHEVLTAFFEQLATEARDEA
ncbi:MAG: HD domain-containing protein [Anaerolineales bacterium]|nr:HD domain-containing protein [Anaerolineales bacterium]